LIAFGKERLNDFSFAGVMFKKEHSRMICFKKVYRKSSQVNQKLFLFKKDYAYASIFPFVGR
jgi:hypothetical protein